MVVLGVELRRLRPNLRRAAVMTAVAVPIAGVLGGQDLLVFVLLILGLGLGMQVPVELVRDRIRGDLLLLSVLPVPAAIVSAGKFAASAVVCLGSAALYAVAAGLAVPGVVPALSPLQAAAATFFSSWLLFTVSSFVATALLARFKIQTLTGGSLPLAILGGMVGLGWLLERWDPDPWASVGWLLAQPWMPLASTVLILLLAALVSWIAFRVTTAGIRDYRPERDAVSW